MPKKISTEIKKKIVELRNAGGCSFKQIAEQLGLSRNTVQKYYENEKERPNSTDNEEWDKKIWSLFCQGKSPAAIIAEIGRQERVLAAAEKYKQLTEDSYWEIHEAVRGERGISLLWQFLGEIVNLGYTDTKDAMKDIGNLRVCLGDAEKTKRELSLLKTKRMEEEQRLENTRKLIASYDNPMLIYVNGVIVGAQRGKDKQFLMELVKTLGWEREVTEATIALKAVT